MPYYTEVRLGKDVMMAARMISKEKGVCLEAPEGTKGRRRLEGEFGKRFNRSRMKGDVRANGEHVEALFFFLPLFRLLLYLIIP